MKWVWSPVARFSLPINTSEYPGDRYVDVLGLSGFNGGTALPWTGWRSFASLFDPSLATLHQLAPGKPVQISEVGSAEAGGNKAFWIARMFADLHAHPQVTSVIWFDLRKQTDWRISSSAAARPGSPPPRGNGPASGRSPKSRLPTPPPAPAQVTARHRLRIRP